MAAEVAQARVDAAAAAAAAAAAVEPVAAAPEFLPELGAAANVGHQPPGVGGDVAGGGVRAQGGVAAGGHGAGFQPDFGRGSPGPIAGGGIAGGPDGALARTPRGATEQGMGYGSGETDPMTSLPRVKVERGLPAQDSAQGLRGAWGTAARPAFLGPRTPATPAGQPRKFSSGFYVVVGSLGAAVLSGISTSAAAVRVLEKVRYL